MSIAGIVVQLRKTGQGSDHRQGDDRLDYNIVSKSAQSNSPYVSVLNNPTARWWREQA